MPEQDLRQDLSNLLDEGTVPIPPFNLSNFFQVTRLFLHLWIVEQTKHRLFRWYIKMLDYIANNEVEYGRVPELATSAEATESES